jgi:4'-phosphopantetheinyl transferase
VTAPGSKQEHPGAPTSSIELWLVDLDAVATAASAAVADLGLADVLPAPAPDAHLRRRRTAHITLRSLLLLRVDPAIAVRPFAPRPQGKPELPGAGLELSLSHSGNHALIGLSRAGAIGVDLEVPRLLQMSPERREAIERAGVMVGGGADLPGRSPDARALASWVRLEAVAKATGEGIGRLLTRLDVRPGRAAPQPAGLGPLPLARDLALPEGLVGAVAVDAGTVGAIADVAVFTAEHLARAVSARLQA